MARASQARSRRSIPEVHHPDSKTAPAMVASHGVQARLVRVDPARECEFARLLAEYELLCREWERLVHRAIDLLGPDFQPDQPGERPLAHKVAE